MDSRASVVFNFHQFIQFLAVQQGYPFFPDAIAVLFDEAYYLRQNPDVSAAIQSGLISSGAEHFFTVGIQENRAPSAFFNEELYLIANPDLQAAVDGGAFSHGLQHYVLFGFEEGRDALALTTRIGGLKLSALFDEAYYLKVYQDIAAAIAAGSFAYGFEHFMQFGRFEGRNPSHYYTEALYLANHPDVHQAVEAGTFSSGLVHYGQFGHFENRLASALFNPETYRANNPDLARALDRGELQSLLQHFLDFGVREGRLASAVFDEADYLDQNPDIQNAVEKGVFPSGYAHFLQHGISEQRSPNPRFDEQSYLSANPDVQNAVNNGLFASGLMHYLTIGYVENRDYAAIAPDLDLDYAESAQAVLVDLDKNSTSFLKFGADFRLMPLGDSITEGWDASKTVDAMPEYRDTHEGYRWDLRQKFAELGLPVDFVGSQNHGPSTMLDTDHEGNAGKSFGFFLKPLDNATPRIIQLLSTYQPDVILLMLGTNNNRASIMISGMTDLLSTIKNNSNFQGHVLVGTIPPAQPNGEWQQRNPAFDEFNDELHDIVASQQSDRFQLVEVGSLLDAVEDMASPSVDNGLHPNQQGYALMAEAWYQALEALLVTQTANFGNEKVNVTGSDFDDVLIGDNRANVLVGGLGEDALTGKGGSDVFRFQSLAEGIDRITDFSGNDTIQVVDAGFAGDLSAGFDFKKGGSPIVSGNGPTFLYNTSDGTLSYDPDGTGGQSATPLAQLMGAPNLTAGQIAIA